jgi:hypothetical protein
MSRSRILIACAALACAFPVCAQTTTTTTTKSGQGNPAQFAQHKQNELNKIQAHMQILQTLQSCVQAATDHAAIHSCNQTAEAARQQLRAQGGN